MHVYRIKNAWLGNKELRILIDCKVNMNQQCYMVWKKANTDVGYIKWGIISESQKVIIPLFAVWIPYPVLSTNFKKDLKKLEQVRECQQEWSLKAIDT